MVKKKVEAKVWSRIVAGFAGFTIIAAGIAAGIAAYDEYRPFPTKLELLQVQSVVQSQVQQVQSQLQQVAGRSCKNELSFFKQELRIIRRDIEQAIVEKNKRWERTLRQQERDVLEEIARVKRECGWS